MRRQIADVLAEADRVGGEIDEYLVKRAQRRQQPRPDEIIRKDYHGDQPAVPTSWPQPQRFMDDATQKLWDDWADKLPAPSSKIMTAKSPNIITCLLMI